jgi:hypothetical protein
MSSVDTTRNHHLGILTPPSDYFGISEEESFEYAKSNQAKTINETYESTNIVTPEGNNIGFFQRALNFLTASKIEDAQSISPVTGKAEQATIDFAPTIDKPDNFDLRLTNFRLTKTFEPTSKLSDQQIFEGLSLMSETTIHQVLMAVLAAQDDLTRDGALLNIDELELFHKMQIWQQKVLQEIKVALSKDEAISGYFNTAQTLAMAAGILATIASFFGYEIPYAQIASGVSTAISTAGKSYFDVRADEDKQKLVVHDHETKVRKRHMDDAAERFEKLSKEDVAKQFSKLLREIIQMFKMINS